MLEMTWLPEIHWPRYFPALLCVYVPGVRRRGEFVVKCGRLSQLAMANLD